MKAAAHAELPGPSRLQQWFTGLPTLPCQISVPFSLHSLNAELEVEWVPRMIPAKSKNFRDIVRRVQEPPRFGLVCGFYDMTDPCGCDKTAYWQLGVSDKGAFGTPGKIGIVGVPFPYLANGRTLNV